MAKSQKPKPPTKTQILTNIAETTELSKKDVAAVFDALSEEIAKAIGRNGPGQFAIPGSVSYTHLTLPTKRIV